MMAERYKGMDLEQLKASRSLLEETLKDAGAEIRGNAVKCWMHDDRHPSGSIYAGEKGPRFKCRPCDWDGSILDVLAEIDHTTVAEVIRAIRSNGSKPKTVYPDLDSLKAAVGDVTHVYSYANGLTVLRLRDKSFRQAAKVEGGYIQQAPKGLHPLYNIQRVADAARIVLVEGEKDVRNLHAYGIVAVTSAGGSKSAQGTDWSPLSGKACVLWPDSDATGRAYMGAVKAIIQADSDVSEVEPSELDLAEKEDVTDFIDQLKVAGTPKQQIKAKLLDVIDNAKSTDLCSGIEQEIEDCISGKRESIDWPWKSVNEYTQALLPDTIVLFCGNMGASKSFSMLEALGFWIELGYDAVIYMLEKTLDFHLLRVLAQKTGNPGYTRPDWIKNNPDEARQLFADNRDYLTTIGRGIYTCRQVWTTQDEVCRWCEARAKAGSRILVVDPITSAEGKGQVWEADRRFLNQLRGISKQYGCSIILVTHPIKFADKVDISMLAGGAAYMRASTAVIWLESHDKPKTSKVVTAVGRTEYRHNRTLHLLKTRSSYGQGKRLACSFDGSLKLREHGVIGD